jgi:gluconolactonase
MTVYQDAIDAFINTDFEIEHLANDLQFTEGPVYNRDGYYLFSDTTANAVIKLVPGRSKEVYLDNSGTNNPDDPDLKPGQAGSNALAYTNDGTLLVCRHGSHSIDKFTGAALEPFIRTFEGKPLNSPNDLILHSDGRIYFSDPPYGLKDGQLNPGKYQPLAGVYLWRNGQLSLICDKYQYPNGVVLSADESRLFICSNKPFEKFVSVYDTHTNEYLGVFAEENSDGIETDQAGHIYLCNKDGIIVLDQNGQRMALIQFPSIPANCCWGGADGKDLFITARQNIFLIRNFRK